MDKINTCYEMKSTPMRDLDWIATLDGYQEGDALGHGETEVEAKEMLLEKLNDTNNKGE